MFVLLGLKTVFIGYYELISCVTDVSNSFVRAYVRLIHSLADMGAHRFAQKFTRKNHS